MGLYLTRAAARLSAFGPSKFVVGSSSASIPQLRQKVSAKANLMIREARTYARPQSQLASYYY